jgi:hypothetical protein
MSVTGHRNEQPVCCPPDHTLKHPFELRRRGVEVRCIFSSEAQRPLNVDPLLIETLARATNWLARLTSAEGMSTAELARQEGIDDGEISRVLPLVFLAPDIIEAIVQGRQPMTLTAPISKGTNR